MIKKFAFKYLPLSPFNDQSFGRAILTHGGAGSNPDFSDGPFTAAQAGMVLMNEGQSALDAVVQAVCILEDDPRFNAGTGSQRRADNRTVQMDASCMGSDGRFGAVACVEGVRNPIKIAQSVLMHSDHILMMGEGARQFARLQNIPTHPLLSSVENHNPTNSDRDASGLSDRAPSCDTVGAIAYDGNMFAAALSTGGLANAAIGRVGDVPLPGCGLFSGPIGAVACTGDGEFIALKMLAREVYGWLEQRMSPIDAAKKALKVFDNSVDIGLIILSNSQFAAHSRNGMAWSKIVSTKTTGRRSGQ